MGDLILFRGLPGSGKTTLAHLLIQSVFSADDFFYDEHGIYRFEPDKLPLAHSQCIERVKDAMVKEISPVAVANTLTTAKEMDPYRQLAEEFGYRVHSLVVENRHGSESVHQVPQMVHDAMHERFEVQL